VGDGNGEDTREEEGQVWIEEADLKRSSYIGVTSPAEAVRWLLRRSHAAFI